MQATVKSILLFVVKFVTHAFRKHLLYPTELRGQSAANVFELADECQPFCTILTQNSSYSIVFHNHDRGNTGKTWSTSLTSTWGQFGEAVHGH